MKRGTRVDVLLPTDLEEWIGFARSVSGRTWAEETLACVRECKRQSESLQFKVKTADLVDALRVMVMAYNSDYQKWLREEAGEHGLREGDISFPLVQGPIKRVSQAMALLERIDGKVDRGAS